MSTLRVGKIAFELDDSPQVDPDEKPESSQHIADCWASWRAEGEQSPWVIAMRQCEAKGYKFTGWMTGMPGRDYTPFWMPAFDKHGRKLGVIASLEDLQDIAAS